MFIVGLMRVLTTAPHESRLVGKIRRLTRRARDGLPRMARARPRQRPAERPAAEMRRGYFSPDFVPEAFAELSQQSHSRSGSRRVHPCDLPEVQAHPSRESRSRQTPRVTPLDHRLHCAPELLANRVLGLVQPPRVWPSPAKPMQTHHLVVVRSLGEFSAVLRLAEQVCKPSQLGKSAHVPEWPPETPETRQALEEEEEGGSSQRASLAKPPPQSTAAEPWVVPGEAEAVEQALIIIQPTSQLPAWFLARGSKARAARETDLEARRHARGKRIALSELRAYMYP